MIAAARLTRRAIDLVIALIVLATLAFTIASAAAPSLGYTLVVLRGDSMSPTAPRGSLVLAHAVASDALRTGDVVTFRTPSGTLVTHRILRVIDRPDGAYLQTQGDANAAPDPQAFPAAWVIGRAEAWLPAIGFLLVGADAPVLLVALVGVLVVLGLAASLLDDLAPARPAAADAPAPVQG